MLIDRFNRKHDYLRISVTDKCNLRCNYCMPENVSFLHNEKLLTPFEIIQIAKTFVNKFGIQKIRFTGGEPLSYLYISQLIKEISKLRIGLALTTNGSLLHKFFPLLKESGLTSLNISLDSQIPEKFFAITKRDIFKTVIDNIEQAIRKQFHVKINMVVMRNVNDNEIIDFVKWTLDTPVHVRFIEFMPFVGNDWHPEKVIPNKEIKARIKNIFSVEKIIDNQKSTAKSYRIKNAKGTFAFISTVSEPFCQNCNRLRLSADGKLRNCLFDKDGIDLLSSLRRGLNIEKLIISSVQIKEQQHGGCSITEINPESKMFAIGG